jgi:hypothetical protein
LEVWASNIGVIGEHFQFETPHNNRPLSDKAAAFPKSFELSTKPILFKDGHNKTTRLVFQNYIGPGLNASTQRDALVSERDALVSERDALVGSSVWRYTRIIRITVSFVRRYFAFK